MKNSEYEILINMGIDAHAIFDVVLSEDDLLNIGIQLNELNTKLVNICKCDISLLNWDVDIFENEVEVYSRCGFGLWSNGNLLHLWNGDRWKWIISHESCYIKKYLEICRLIGRLIGAKRVVYLSDILTSRYKNIKDFDELLNSLGKPFDISKPYYSLRGYQEIFFYEKF